MGYRVIGGMGDFNPRSPHGERPHSVYGARVFGDISIHAPRTGSDDSIIITIKEAAQFQSTLPARGATLEANDLRWGSLISIHAPRTGSDGGGVTLGTGF